MLFVKFLRCVEKIRTIGVWYCLFCKICHVAKLPEIDSKPSYEGGAPWTRTTTYKLEWRRSAMFLDTTCPPGRLSLSTSESWPPSHIEEARIFLFTPACDLHYTGRDYHQSGDQ